MNGKIVMGWLIGTAAGVVITSMLHPSFGISVLIGFVCAGLGIMLGMAVSK